MKRHRLNQPTAKKINKSWRAYSRVQFQDTMPEADYLGSAEVSIGKPRSGWRREIKKHLEAIGGGNCD